MSTLTTGPWFITPAGPGSPARITAPRPDYEDPETRRAKGLNPFPRLTAIAVMEPGPHRDSMDANARAIAQVPAMVDAIRTSHGDLNSLCHDLHGGHDVVTLAVIARVSAVLARLRLVLDAVDDRDVP